MTTIARVQDYSNLAKELWTLLSERRSTWLAPLIFAILLLGALGFFLEGSVLAPAIYSIF